MPQAKPSLPFQLSMGLRSKHVYSKPAMFSLSSDSRSLRPQLSPHSQRSKLFTKQHFLISHSPTSMADQWHLVQYFIKSFWKLTVQSIRKLQSLSNINYLAGCDCSMLHSPFAVETFIAVEFLHILDARSVTFISPFQTVNIEKKCFKFLSKKRLFRSRMNDFCGLL